MYLRKVLSSDTPHSSLPPLLPPSPGVTGSIRSIISDFFSTGTLFQIKTCNYYAGPNFFIFDGKKDEDRERGDKCQTNLMHLRKKTLLSVFHPHVLMFGMQRLFHPYKE